MFEDASRPSWRDAAPQDAAPSVEALVGRLTGVMPAGTSATELVEAVAGYERVVAWAQARQMTAIAALADRLSAEQVAFDDRAVAEEDRIDGPELASAELQARLHLTTLSANLRVGEALALTTVHTDTRDAWEAGHLDGPRVRRILGETELLPAALAAAVACRVLDRAPHQTTSQLTAALRRAVLTVDPDAARRRRTKACEARVVTVLDLPDAAAELRARGPVEQVHTVFGCLDVLAGDHHPSAQDPRRVGARRFDALHGITAALLAGHHLHIARDGTLATTGDDAASAGAAASAGTTGDRLSGDSASGDSASGDSASGDSASGDSASGDSASGDSASGDSASGDSASGDSASGGASTEGTDATGARRSTRRRRSRDDTGGHAWWSRRAQLHVTVAATTLLGLDDDPAHLAGHGPIPADLARDLAADATWRRLLLDDPSGALLDIGTATYHPGAPLRRHIQIRDPVCVFPGCRQPAHRCDLDHEQPFPHGPTSAENLSPLCRRHHRLKTHTRWRKNRQPDGATAWTSPTGHIYTVPATDLRTRDASTAGPDSEGGPRDTSTGGLNSEGGPRDASTAGPESDQ